MNLSEYALKNKALVKFLILVLVVGGIFSFVSMSKLEDPEIRVKEALVVTVYPGASAHKVELEVTDILEKEIRAMGDIARVESKSMSDLSIITVELESTVPPGELEQRWDILRRRVSDAALQLPDGCRPPVVKDDFGDVYGMFYAMTTDGIPDEEMVEYANLVKRELQHIPEVRRVDIYGDRKPCINIDILQDRMANLGVHPAEILSTLNNQNRTVYSGYFISGRRRLRVGVGDSYESIRDIGQLLIRGHEDDQLRLQDVATVSRAYEEPVRNGMRYDGERALGISVSMTKGGNIVTLGKRVDDKLAELQAGRIPVGVEFRKVFFQPDRVREAIGTFMVNLAESVLVVIVVLMLAMGFRSGVIIGCGLVIIVLGSFAVLYLLDGTLQRVSLAALIVAMGMLVDNAIVIVDGILVDLKRGIPRPAALTNIGGKTAMPLLGATLIAILAFFPIFVSPDIVGEYVRDLFIVLAVSLLLSWILALTQIPVHAARFLKGQGGCPDGGEVYGGRIYRQFRTFLACMLRHKRLAVGGVAVLLGLSVWCFRYIPRGFFPDLSYAQLYIEYKMPEGVTLEAVQDDLSDMEAYLLSRGDITHVTASMGGTPSRYNLVRSIALPAISYGELIVDFKDAEALKASIPELQRDLTARYPEAYVRIKRYNLMYEDFPVELLFSGPDPAVLKELAGRAQRIMEDEPSAGLVTNNWEPEMPVMMADYYQPVARQSGLSRADVGLSLLAATDGLPVGACYEGATALPIYVRSVDGQGRSPAELENTPVWSMLPSLAGLGAEETLKGLLSGTLKKEEILAGAVGSTPLSQATRGIKLKWEDPVVWRYDGQRAIKARCNNMAGHTAESVRRRLMPLVDTITLPEGYSVRWLGEHKASSESMRYLFGNVPWAIVMMIVILIALFKDFRKPAVIFLCLPLAAIGIVFGMLLSGKEFGFVAIVGALGLIGMMIKNGVVLIDEIALQVAGGKAGMQALLDASSSRFRPVMMASLTTILGMVPLLGDDLFGSLAVTIMGGLSVGTVITLVFIPVLYALFFPLAKGAGK